MSEEETINTLQLIKQAVTKVDFEDKTKTQITRAIETILDLYQQKKERIKELEEKQNRLAFKTNQYMNDVLSNNIVSKDKIKAKIKELEEKSDYWNCDEIEVLKELLEE